MPLIFGDRIFGLSEVRCQESGSRGREGNARDLSSQFSLRSSIAALPISEVCRAYASTFLINLLFLDTNMSMGVVRNLSLSGQMVP